MKFMPSIIAAAVLVTRAHSAPTTLMATAEQWAIESLKRICNEEDTTCTWTFNVNTHAEDTEPTEVEYIVEASGGTPASQAVGGPSKFGVFTVTSTWSEYFGPEEAWTTMSVIDYDRGILVYPAYKDKQVADGEVVEPDQLYVPEKIPA